MSDLAVVEPAPLFEARALLLPYALALFPFRLGHARRFVERAATHQIVASRTVAVLLDGRVVAVAGAFPLPGGDHEIFLVFAPGPEPRRHLLSLVRVLRLTLRRFAQNRQGRLFAFVAEGHAPGARLGLLLGFTRVGVSGGRETWEMRRGASDTVDFRSE